MGKSSQVAVDHDSSSDRITARVGSRTKKAKVVFDPSDHHVPRKRNRRGENDVDAKGTPKSESNRTATPSSPSSTDGTSNHNQMPTTTPPATAAAAPAATAAAAAIPAAGQRGTASTSSYRTCKKCGRSGPGRMPRKTPTTAWTCSACLVIKTESKTVSATTTTKQQAQAEKRTKKPRSGRGTTEEEEEDDDIHDAQEEEDLDEEDNKQQHDFAGFSEMELGGHVGNVNTALTDERLSDPIKHELSTDSDDGQTSELHERTSAGPATKDGQSDDDEEGTDESRKEIRYWTCDDVCRFFSKHCKAWGDIFQEQEIDGPSLLLIRKTDVLSRFGLKLGPAMELYQRIVALQNGDRDIVDVRLTWI
ncbi:scm-like with four MBT domains protein 1 [Anopheles arabiensis]|uniref:Uncharacterized protein n=1 Tax=Anopheles arabiensis TaxID=7173 RepID=A0A1Y9GKN8_ANOAR|nr:scm-like with four MBT domains protein 1 [Anopheles arabiensis]